VEVPIQVCSLEGGALEGVSPRVFPNLRRIHEYWNHLPLNGNNSLFISLLLSHFVQKKCLHGNMGTWEHIKLTFDQNGPNTKV
jgi:hypothetical protein